MGFYNEDGTLSSDRSVDCAGNNLTFDNIKEFQVILSDSNTGIDIYNLEETRGLDVYLNGGDNVNVGLRLDYLMLQGKNIELIGTFAPSKMFDFVDGGNVTIPDGQRGIYYNPSEAQSSPEITLPANPINGQETLIVFGGQITTGTVVSDLVISPNTDQTLVGVYPTAVDAGTAITLKWKQVSAQWFVI